ncbi:MAG: MetQ/NlpA family ABC transporter substrate-binding protein [Succiniclasticum sp.]|jgi:lipoprotein, yaeC family|nr:MetQ/NlpA family ABC transporter substrate-binding protein [Selenomonadales bacterium]MDY6304310.1 MetQ/NlpA family ABC transporter substrate-binding protein [Succiniclasticum sp.]MDY6345475.1 MetQ/NlpA family ABC transporter substrate-binding protein [Succiniclasticum sp.]
MQTRKLFTVLLSALAVLLLVAGCGGNDKKAASGSGKALKIGATAGAHAEVVHAVAAEAKKQGLNVEVVEFTDYITPDKALAEGNLDLNAYQHVPFLNNFNKQHGTKLVPIGNTILIRQGLISDKIHDLKDVPTGATVAIPNDPTNGGRALLLLQQAGLLRLKDGVGYKATPKDVTDNPKQLKFKELEAAQLPRSLADVDLAAITMNYILSSGIDPKKQGLFWEKKDEPLAVMVLAAREEDKDKPEFKKIVEIYKSETIKKFIEDKFHGTIQSAN